MYCSSDCYADDIDKPPQKRQFKKICQNCGKEFQAVHSNDKFCSRECRENFHSEQRKVTFENRECVVCGKIFTPTHYRQITCSAECRKENDLFREEIRQIKIAKCEICGKEFVSTHGKKTCSKECLQIYKNRESNNPNTFWRVLKKKAKFYRKKRH